MKQESPPAEPATFEELHAEHATRVLRMAGHFGVARREREDVAQEVWLVVGRSLPLYDPDKGTARAWIAGITRNAARDWRRTRRRRPELTVVTDQEPPDPRATSAETETAEARRREALWAFVERALPNEDQREALLLHEVEGMTVQEVADVMEVRFPTAKWRIEMARIKLKKAAESLSDEERERMRAVIVPLGGVDGILQALRESLVVSDEQVVRVWDRVVERLEAEGGSIHDRLGAPEKPGAPPPGAPPAPRGYGLRGWRLAGALGGVFVLGALSGAGAHALWSRDREPVSQTAIDADLRPAPGPTAEPSPEPAPTASASAAPGARGRAAPPWESEVLLLVRARKAPPGEALRLADEHAARFSRSKHAAEREEIAIGALVKLGRRTEAEERGAKLVEQMPSRRPAVEELLSE